MSVFVLDRQQGVREDPRGHLPALRAAHLIGGAEVDTVVDPRIYRIPSNSAHPPLPKVVEQRPKTAAHTFGKGWERLIRKVLVLVGEIVSPDDPERDTKLKRADYYEYERTLAAVRAQLGQAAFEAAWAAGRAMPLTQAAEQALAFAAGAPIKRNSV